MKQIEFIPIEEKTLNDKLVNLYGRHLTDLYREVESNYKEAAVKPTMPLLLSFLKDEDQGIDHLLDWEKADVRLMIFGRETNGWNDGEREEGYDWESYNFNLQTSDDILAEIRGKHEGDGPEIKGIQETYEGYFYETEYPTNFTVRTRQFVERLRTRMGSCQVEYIWNNLYKIAQASGSGFPKGDIRDMEWRLFNVIAEEVSILKPDVILFMTGTEREHTTDSAIREKFGLPNENFPRIDETLPHLRRVQIPGVKYAARTIHPTGRRSNDEVESYNNALIEDIVKHLS